MASRIPDDKWKNLPKHGKEFLEQYRFLDQASGENIPLDESMKSLLGEDSQKLLLKSDVVNLIRFYCCLYSDFNPKALKVLKARTLEQFNPFMKDIPQDQRKEMYKSMIKLFDAVRGWRLQGCKDSALIDKDTMEIKKRLAVFIFPEKFQRGVTQCDATPVQSDIPVPDDNYDNYDQAWHHDNMPEFEDSVSESQLLELGVVLKPPETLPPS